MKWKHILFVATAVALTWIVVRLSDRTQRRGIETKLHKAEDEINTLACMLNQFRYQ